MKKKLLLIVLIFIMGFMFIRPVEAEHYDTYNPNTVSCGSGYLKDIPQALPKITRIVYTILQIVVPIVLVIAGSIDLVKGLTAEKEDEITKGRKMFLKRIVTAGIIFFVLSIVKLVISVVSSDRSTSNRISMCAECFLVSESKCDYDYQYPLPSGED